MTSGGWSRRLDIDLALRLGDDDLARYCEARGNRPSTKAATA